MKKETDFKKIGEIPHQLKQLKFCRIKKRTKIPFEKEWPVKPYSYEEISKFFPRENYGVVCGYHDLAVIDCDNPTLELVVKELLPETFKVRTGRGGSHFYYFIPELKKKIILNAGEEHLGEIQSFGSQVVGIGSTHPNGKKYELVNNVGIKTISLKVLEGVLGNFMKKEGVISTGEKTEDVEDYKKLINEIVKVWKTGDRQELALSVSGYLRKEKRLGIKKVKSIIKEVCEITDDEELKMRLRAVDETFKKDEKDIKGFSGLGKVNLKEDKIKSFLIEDRQKYESLGCGFHKGVYYIGTKLFRENKPYTAIITYDKKAYLKLEALDEIRNLFGLNYKDNFYDEGLDNIFSKEAVNKWLFENTDKITLKSVYEKLVSLFKKYIYLEDERKYSLLACYRIASFFMPVWRARARLFIYAEMGSAKSRLTQIMHNTGFNSIALGDWTLAYLQRLIESTRGETHIDDYETLDEDKKNATTRLIKTGFMKGFKAGKISEGKNRKPETYDLFNTTTLNNTEGLDFISTDRTITIRIPKISKKEYDKEPNFSEPIWKELRDELYILGLKYPEQVAKTYEAITSDKIRGRLFFIIKPELTIAKLISENLYNELEDFWSEEIEQRQSIDFETDWEFLAYKQIYKLLSTLSTNSTLSTLSTLSTTSYLGLLEDVVKPVGINLYGEEEFKHKKRSMSIVIGKCLSRNPIFKKRQVKGKNQYKVNFEELKSLLEAKGFLKPIMEILGVDKVDSGDSVGGEMGERQDNIDFSKSGVKETLEDE